MCVDDEAILLEVMRRILARAGYDVMTATDAREASRLLRATPGTFDLVITDESMPDVTGFDLAALARSLRANQGVILMTGMNDGSLEAQAEAAGIKRVLGKPFLPAELLDAVEQALRPAASEG